MGNWKNRMFNHWNDSTRCCYRHKGKCEFCPNGIVCDTYDNLAENEYQMRAVKYAMMMTFAKIGKPRGEENDT